LRVVSGEGEHFVLYTRGGDDGPSDIVFGPLLSREAALIAFDDLVEHLLENGPLGDGGRSVRGGWDRIARITGVLRDHEGWPAEQIARRLSEFLDLTEELDWLYSRKPQALDHEDPPMPDHDMPF
jgi:hypothetical protein